MKWCSSEGVFLMATEMWPGASITSADLRIYQNGRFSSVQDDSDDQFSDTSLDSSDLSSEDEPVLPEPQHHTSSKPRKRVTFRTEENLVEIFEIPARGDGPEFEVYENDVKEVVRPKEFILQEEPQSELMVSGQAANVVANKITADGINGQQDESKRPMQERQEVHRVPVRKDRTEKPVISRTNNNNNNVPNRTNNNNVPSNKYTDAWGTYTVTHAIAPGPNPPRAAQPKAKFSQTVQSKPQTTTSSPSASPDPTTVQTIPQKSTPAPRRNIRAKSAGKTRKKVSKTTKDSKTCAVKSPGSDNISDGDQKLIAMFLQKNNNDGTDTEKETPPVKVQKSKNTKTKGHKRIPINAKNREKEMINKEMKGEGQKRIYRTPYNNISSLNKNGTRLLFRRPNTADASDSKNNTDITKAKSASKHSASIESGPRVKVVPNGRGRPQSNSNEHKSGAKNINPEKDSKDENESKNNANGMDKTEQSKKLGYTKSGFIFPEENSFHFPLMSQPKETTSQLVRLDTNMLSLYKQKLYAWHMANGTPAEGRVQTPCISPMYESMKNSYS